MLRFYRVNEMDFFEIQDFCGFDMDKANEMAEAYENINLKEANAHVAALESKPGTAEPDRRLRDPGHRKGDGQELE